MTTPNPEQSIAILSAHLWDLRCQIESQLRRVTDAQKRLDVIRNDPARAAQDLDHIRAYVDDVRRAGATITEVPTLALDLRQG